VSDEDSILSASLHNTGIFCSGVDVDMNSQSHKLARFQVVQLTLMECNINQPAEEILDVVPSRTFNLNGVTVVIHWI
jgi:hypothetical protein